MGDMRREIYKTERLIKEQRRRILQHINDALNSSQQIQLEFSSVCMYYFKMYRSQAEDDGADESALQSQLKILR